MPIKNRWYMIGTALEVSLGDLDSIKYSNIPVDEKLATMMSTWLDKYGKKATWEVLLKAVESKIVDSHQTGEKIREILKIPERSDCHSHSERGRILHNAFTKMIKNFVNLTTNYVLTTRYHFQRKCYYLLKCISVF